MNMYWQAQKKKIHSSKLSISLFNTCKAMDDSVVLHLEDVFCRQEQTPDSPNPINSLIKRMTTCFRKTDDPNSGCNTSTGFPIQFSPCNSRTTNLRPDSRLPTTGELRQATDIPLSKTPKQRKHIYTYLHPSSSTS
jgi:hypothetical protein